MYLKTPKRYQPRRKPQRHMVSSRWLWLWVLTPLVVLAGWQVYQRQDQFGPPVREFINQAVDDAQGQVATLTAPTPLPTTDPAERLARANQSWDRGAIEEALNEYRIALDGAPNDALSHYRYTMGLIMQGQVDEAVAAAERTVTANPFSADGWAIRALALDRAERYTEAITSALQALAIDPSHARAMAFMAEAYMDADRPDLAEPMLTRALDADPDSAEVNYVNGLYQTYVNYLYDDAAAAFSIANDAAPNLPYITVERAWMEWRLQDYDTAIGLLNDVLELNPTNLEALYAIGYIYSQALGDYNQALDYFLRCRQADPTNISCVYRLALTQEALGDSQGSLESYRALMGTDTQTPLHFLYAGRAFMNAGDCASATPALRNGYQLESTLDDADPDTLALFQDYLAECGVAVSSPVVEATVEAVEETSS